MAVEQLPAAILKAQSCDVDSVSGATISSTSIKKAAKEAMMQAGLMQAKAGKAKGAGMAKGTGTLTLESINEFLNSSADMGEGTVANAVTLIAHSDICLRREHDVHGQIDCMTLCGGVGGEEDELIVDVHETSILQAMHDSGSFFVEHSQIEGHTLVEQ